MTTTLTVGASASRGSLELLLLRKPTVSYMTLQRWHEPPPGGGQLQPRRPVPPHGETVISATNCIELRDSPDGRVGDPLMRKWHDHCFPCRGCQLPGGQCVETGPRYNSAWAPPGVQGNVGDREENAIFNPDRIDQIEIIAGEGAGTGREYWHWDDAPEAGKKTAAEQIDDIARAAGCVWVFKDDYEWKPYTQKEAAVIEEAHQTRVRAAMTGKRQARMGHGNNVTISATHAVDLERMLQLRRDDPWRTRKIERRESHAPSASAPSSSVLVLPSTPMICRPAQPSAPPADLNPPQPSAPPATPSVANFRHPGGAAQAASAVQNPLSTDQRPSRYAHLTPGHPEHQPIETVNGGAKMPTAEKFGEKDPDVSTRCVECGKAPKIKPYDCCGGQKCRRKTPLWGCLCLIRAQNGIEVSFEPCNADNRAPTYLFWACVLLCWWLGFCFTCDSGSASSGD